MSNTIIYNIAKTKAKLFWNAYSKKAIKKFAATKLLFGEQKVMFTNKTISWLGVWFDSRLTFIIHIREKVKKAQAAKARIRSFISGLV